VIDPEAPYGLDIEYAAASLWRRENPEMNVFACDHAMMEQYRLRVLKIFEVNQSQKETK
jgi:hypothetical protein